MSIRACPPTCPPKLQRRRVIRGCFLFLALSAASVSAAELTIIRVFTGWHDAPFFKHISEYFNGRENTHGEVMLRTHAAQRAGYYYFVRIVNHGAPAAVKINVQMITPTESRPKTHTFETNLKSGETVLNLGLTGADWPDAKANPVAWKLDVVAADGRVLATEKSYLWEKPSSN
jgi:hypothetical protein